MDSSRVTGEIQYDANTGYLKANGNNVGGGIRVVGTLRFASAAPVVVNAQFDYREFTLYKREG